MARRYDTRRAKILRTYTVPEVAKLLGVHKHTAGRWIAAGLPVVDRRKPQLIRGADLRAFLAARQPPKQPSPPGHMFCFRCRAPKRPAGGAAYLLAHSVTAGTLTGHCSTCGARMHRAINPRKIEEVRGDLAVTHRQAEQRLDDSPGTLLHVAFRKDTV